MWLYHLREDITPLYSYKFELILISLIVNILFLKFKVKNNRATCIRGPTCVLIKANYIYKVKAKLALLRHTRTKPQSAILCPFCRAKRILESLLLRYATNVIIDLPPLSKKKKQADGTQGTTINDLYILYTTYPDFRSHLHQLVSFWPSLLRFSILGIILFNFHIRLLTSTLALKLESCGLKQIKFFSKLVNDNKKKNL